MPKKNSFTPALGYSLFTGLYDRFSLWAFRKTSFYHAIEEVIRVLAPQPHSRLLELGCGPGRLAIKLKKDNPQCAITAVDRDPAILRTARSNIRKAGLKINFVEQDLTELPTNQKYDRIYSTFVFHHLTAEAKTQVLGKIRHLTKENGWFVLADFCQAKKVGERLKFMVVQWVDGFTSTSPHVDGWLEKNLPRYFKSVKKSIRVSTFLGPVAVFVCKK